MKKYSEEERSFSGELVSENDQRYVVSGQRNMRFIFNIQAQKRVNYSKGSAQRMTNAIQEVQKHPGLPVSRVAITYGVSRKFLSDRVSGRSKSGWLHCFMKKHPNLVRRRTEALDRIRSQSFNAQTILSIISLSAYSLIFQLLSGT